MTGFKNFLLRGNLIELAVAFIMARRVRDSRESDRRPHPRHHRQDRRPARLQRLDAGWLLVGAWLTAIVAFVIMAAVVYFVIVKPYTVAKEKFFPAEDTGHPGRRRPARGDPRPARHAGRPGLTGPGRAGSPVVRGHLSP